MTALPLAFVPAFVAKSSVVIFAQLGLLIFPSGDLVGVLIIFGVKMPELASVTIFAKILIFEMA